jgi:Fe-S-cluster containining protein
MNERLLLQKPGCANCIAACCRDIVLPLDDSEMRTLRKAGTELEFLGRPSVRGRDVRGVYKMIGACGFLKFNQKLGFLACSVHDEERPLVCESFTEAGSTCLKLRDERLRNEE